MPSQTRKQVSWKTGECAACGKKSAGGKFCTSCGGKINQAIACTRCGHPMTSAKAFCLNCGEKMRLKKVPTIDAFLAKSNVAGDKDGAHRMRLLKKMSAAMSNCARLSDFPARLAQKELSSEDLRVLLIALRPNIPSAAVLLSDGTPRDVNQLTQQLYRLVHRIIRGGPLARVLRGTAWLVLGGAAVFTILLLLASSSENSQGCSGSNSNSNSNFWFYMWLFNSPSSSGAYTENTKSHRRANRLMQNGFTALTKSNGMFKAKEVEVRRLAAAAPARWEQVGNTHMAAVCNSADAAIESVWKAFRTRRRRDIGRHRGLAIHLVHPVTGELRGRPDEVCAASAVYRGDALRKSRRNSKQA